MKSEATFDPYAEEYDQALERGISISGETKDYFARKRLEFLSQCLRELGRTASVRSVLDFGCGTGSAVPHILDVLKADSVVGVDVSRKSLAIAERVHGAHNVSFIPFTGQPVFPAHDLAFCNGVFHHIATTDREAALSYIRTALKPDGLFAFWENNPWNPGTRIIMRRCPFDLGAITLTASSAQALLRRNGFRMIRKDFLFIFPRFLSALRRIEPALSKWPAGAQYQIVCRKA